jgi:hypothetical protein
MGLAPAERLRQAQREQAGLTQRADELLRQRALAL